MVAHSEDVWVPVTLHLPIGFAKAWNPGHCAPVSFMCGPYAIILLAQVRRPSKTRGCSTYSDPGRPQLRTHAGPPSDAASLHPPRSLGAAVLL